METMSKVLIAVLIVFLQNVSAGEVYKWTDEQGKVHFGDQKAKPRDIKAESVVIQPQETSATSHSEDMNEYIEKIRKKQGITLSDSSTIPPKEPLPTFDESSSFIISAQRISVECREIAEQIAQTPRGTPFKRLADKFMSQCPRVTYECLQYKKQPEKSKCHWIRNDSRSIVSMKIYN